MFANRQRGGGELRARHRHDYGRVHAAGVGGVCARKSAADRADIITATQTARRKEGIHLPIHNWTLVDADIFHDFHGTWLIELKKALNSRVLPSEYHALSEQIASGLGPDVLTLRKPNTEEASPEDPRGGIAVAAAPPQVRFHARAELDLYAAKARRLMIRHRSNHRLIAVLEIVSPGNKSNRHGLRAFIEKAIAALRAGIHLLIVDLLPPGPRDPQGIHKARWDELIENDFALPQDKPLTLAAYRADQFPEYFVEPVAVGDTLPKMPLFLTPDIYVLVPLEATYRAAWEGFPSFWREVLENPPPSEQQ